VTATGSHEWTRAEDGTPCCYRCGMVKRPENVRMGCAARADGNGHWTLASDASTAALSGGSGTESDSGLTDNAPSEWEG
jgi:hypothetical protein